jgi:hypothetical protein
MTRLFDAGRHEYFCRWLGLRDAEDDVAREMIFAVYRAMYRIRPQVSSGEAGKNG